jgi:DNA-binding NtrC family response regulator
MARRLLGERASEDAMPIKVLVVDDDAQLLAALVELLSSEGMKAVGVTSAEAALDECRRGSFHLVLSDLQLPGRNGISLIKTLHEACPETKTVLITAHGSIRSAVTALKRGAVEYMTKPIKPRRLMALIHALTADAPAYLTNKLLASDRLEVATFDGMHARSTVMHTVFERIRTAAAGDSPVLIIGESGSGKELVARAIHARSPFAAGPFVAVPAGTVPSPETATGGTLFVDVSALDDAAQLALLRVLDGARTSPGHVRMVAASTRELEPLVKSGLLREELFYRLNGLEIRLPPLRERSEDIPVLAGEFVREFAQKYNKPVATVPSETQRLLIGYPWPGNVRELRNVIEQAMLLARGSELDPLLLPKMLHRSPSREEIIKIPIGTAMEQVEKEVILRTLEAHDGNKTATAEVLGISRRSIYNKLAIYGLGGPPDRDAPDEQAGAPPPPAPSAARAASGR